MSYITENKELWREFIQLYRSLPELWKVKSDVYKTSNLKNAGYDRQLWTCFRHDICQETEVCANLSCRVWTQSLDVQCVRKVAVHLQKVLVVMSTSVHTGLNPINFIRRHFLQMCMWDVSFERSYCSFNSLSVRGRSRINHNQMYVTLPKCTAAFRTHVTTHCCAHLFDGVRGPLGRSSYRNDKTVINFRKSSCKMLFFFLLQPKSECANNFS
jgi:hypothetical protein